MKMELPKEIHAVDYAGFWDFTEDGCYGDSLINVIDHHNAAEIAMEIAKRYNLHQDLMAALDELLCQVTRDCSIGSDPKMKEMCLVWQHCSQILIKAKS